MAIRNIRQMGDPILRKISKDVPEVNDRIKVLLDDMADTMYKAEGIGLAAVQVGILKRAIVIDPRDEDGLIKMVNPVIVEKDGEQIGVEGCLSVPNFNATVKRPSHIKVEYIDENGKDQSLEAEGLKAVVICHEVDHLNGTLFVDDYIEEVRYDEE
jgi:peptide deformylase